MTSLELKLPHGFVTHRAMVETVEGGTLKDLSSRPKRPREESRPSISALLDIPERQHKLIARQVSCKGMAAQNSLRDSNLEPGACKQQTQSEESEANQERKKIPPRTSSVTSRTPLSLRAPGHDNWQTPTITVAKTSVDLHTKTETASSSTHHSARRVSHTRMKHKTDMYAALATKLPRAETIAKRIKREKTRTKRETLSLQYVKSELKADVIDLT